MKQKELFSILSSIGGSGHLTTMLSYKIARFADWLVPRELCLPEFQLMRKFVRESFRLLPLDEATEALRAATRPKCSLAIEDGFADWLDTGAPVRKDFGLPATFFITTEQVTGAALCHERIIAAVRALRDPTARLPYEIDRFDRLRSLALWSAPDRADEMGEATLALTKARNLQTIAGNASDLCRRTLATRLARRPPARTAMPDAPGPCRRAT
jgi:hypothetical protein